MFAAFWLIGNKSDHDELWYHELLLMMTFKIRLWLSFSLRKNEKGMKWDWNGMKW